MKVYTAGPMQREKTDNKRWREALPSLSRVVWLNPLKPPHADEHNNYKPHWFFPRDIVSIRSADAVLCYIGEGKHRGLCTEIGYAYALGKPLIIVCDTEQKLYEFCFPLKMATAIVDTLQEGVDIIKFMAQK